MCDRALDLPLEQRRVDRLADVVRRDHLRDLALVVEDHDLHRPAVREVRHRVVDVGARRARPVDRDLAVELAPGERAEAFDPAPFSSRLQVLRGLDDRAAAEHRGTRGGRLSGVELAHRVDDDAHVLGR